MKARTDRKSAQKDKVHSLWFVVGGYIFYACVFGGAMLLTFRTRPQGVGAFLIAILDFGTPVVAVALLGLAILAFQQRATKPVWPVVAASLVCSFIVIGFIAFGSWWCRTHPSAATASQLSDLVVWLPRFLGL